MRHRFGLLPIAWLLLLLCIPAIGWAFGARQPLLDNRPKTPWPHLDAHTLRAKATYSQLDAALLERLPPRGRALRAHGRIAVDAFHDSPNPDVAIGSHGYRYYTPGVQTCRPGGGAPTADAADIPDILARTIVASGRKALVLVPGDKLFIHTDDAPTVDAGAQPCAERMERAISTRLAHTPGGFDVDDQLRRLEARGTPVFRKNDTHWSAAGRLLFARRALDLIQPGLAEQVGLHLGPAYDRVGDLSQMLGQTTADHERAVVPARAPARPVKPGSTVIIGDSQMEQTFTEPPGPGLPPLVTSTLPGTPACTQPVLYGGGCDAFIKHASRIVYETVGRNITEMEQICWRVVSLVTEQQITGPAGRYQRLDGVEPLAGRELTIGPTGTITLRVVTPGPDRVGHPRLLKLPLTGVPAGATVTMAQQPQGGRPAPCATPQQYDGGSLILPVPANRRASDMIVTVSGAPGSRLQAPREIQLDGEPAERVARGAGR